ncbi:MAG: FIST N-terminal domain-containing protein [Sedimenticola sp.]
MFISAVGHSEDPDAQGAMDEIREQCEKTLSGHKPKAGIVYAAIDFDHEELLTIIDEFWPGLELIGCTTDGEVSSELGFSEDSIVLLLFASDTIDITAGIGEGLKDDTKTACREAVEMASAKSEKDSALCITLPDVLTGSGQVVVDSLVAELGKSIPLIGGAAGDQWQFQKTFQFYGKRVLSGAVPVLLFSGPLEYSFSLGLGCSLLGSEGSVTKSEGALLLEVDNKPAADYYRKMIGESATIGFEFPLAVLSEDGGIDYLRTPAGDFDPETGAVALFGDIKEGSKIRPSMISRDSALASSAQAGETVVSEYPSGQQPSVALIFSCAGRKMLLGTRTQEEPNGLDGMLDSTIPYAGFYTYGEICPSIPIEDGAKLHNHSLVVALLGERNE